jgi:SAM-dependent methyltransferase
MLDNQMGPNALWLAEWLCEQVRLEPGMRVLDLGCGRAMTSIFLAREFGARVWAADLWIDQDHNWRRVVEAGVADRVCPVRAEAHALPFAQGFFDAVISLDAFHYFGTDELYLAYLSGFVRQGGTVGIVVPGLMQPFENGVPAHLTNPQSNGKRFWEDECWSLKTADWWRHLWDRCGRVDDVRADILPDGWKYWRDFERALEMAGKNQFPSDVEALERDQGRYLGFVRAVATRTEAGGMNLYDPALGVRAGVDT